MQRQFIYIIFLTLVVSCVGKFGKDEVHSYHSEEELSLSKRASYLQSEIRNHPEVIENYLALADIKISEDKLVEAKNLLKLVYGRDPQNPRVVSGLASCYIADREFNKALALMRLASERGVKSLAIYKNMAKAYYFSGKFKLAEYYLNRALQLEKNDWELNYLKGEIAQIENDTTVAFRYYEKAYELYPSDTVFNKMFDFAMARGNMKRSSRYISKNYIKHPGSPDLMYRAGNYYRVRGKVDTSYYLYRQLMSLEPGRVRSYNGLANSFYAQGKYDSALLYAGQALAMDSTAIYSHLIKARALVKRYHYKDAFQEYEHILVMDSTYTIARDELEKLNKKIAYLRSLKKYKESQEELNMIKPLKPKTLN